MGCICIHKVIHMRPYIGITGLKTTDDIKKITGIFDKNCLDSSGFEGMMGFLCDTRNIEDTKREGKRSPSLENLARLIEAVPSRYMGMVHYHTKNHDDLYAESIKLREYVPGFQNIQYNVDWPSIRQLEKIRHEICENIVLQLPARAIEHLDNKQVARITQAYDGLASYVLIDMSGGKGIEMDEEKTADLVHELSKKLMHTTIGVAGGLSAENVASKVGIIKKGAGIERFCIDAEGRLRTDDILSIDMNKAENYILSAIETFR